MVTGMGSRGRKLSIILMVGLSLLTIQALHVAKHDTYCKTESEWRRHLGMSMDEYDEIKRNLNN